MAGSRCFSHEQAGGYFVNKTLGGAASCALQAFCDRKASLCFELATISKSSCEVEGTRVRLAATTALPQRRQSERGAAGSHRTPPLFSVPHGSAMSGCSGCGAPSGRGRAEQGRASRVHPARVGWERLWGASCAPTMRQGKEGPGKGKEKREEEEREEEAPPQHRPVPPRPFRPPPRAMMTRFLPPAPLPRPRAGAAAAILPLSRCRSPGAAAAAGGAFLRGFNPLGAPPPQPGLNAPCPEREPPATR